MEWCPAGWSLCLRLLISPCTIKSRSSLLAPAHRGGPGKRAVKRLWWFCMHKINSDNECCESCCCIANLVSVKMEICRWTSQGLGCAFVLAMSRGCFLARRIVNGGLCATYVASLVILTRRLWGCGCLCLQLTSDVWLLVFDDSVTVTVLEFRLVRLRFDYWVQSIAIYGLVPYIAIDGPDPLCHSRVWIPYICKS